MILSEMSMTTVPSKFASTLGPGFAHRRVPVVAFAAFVTESMKIVLTWRDVGGAIW